jgi:hypothetical protein
MILQLDLDGSLRLAEPHDFTRLHCALGPPRSSLALVHQQLAGTARLENTDTAWIDVAWLRRQRPVEADAARTWLSQLEHMLAQAQPHGWLSADVLEVKAHVVWPAPAEPLPSQLPSGRRRPNPPLRGTL